MRPSTHRGGVWVLAWSLVAVWVGVAALSVTLGSLPFEVGGDHAGTGPVWGDFAAALWVGYAVVGARVAARQPRNWVGWLLLAFALANSCVIAAEAYGRHGSYPGSVALTWFVHWGWYVWLAVILVFLPVAFPDGRMLSGHRRAVTWLGIAAVTSCTVGAAFNPEKVAFSASGRNPLAVGGPVGGVFTGLETGGQVLLALAAVVGGVSLVARLRRSSGVEREQLKWFAFAALLPACGFALALVTALTGTLELWLGGLGWGLIILGSVVAIPAATGIAIFRYRLYDIDRLVNRTLVYGTLTAALLATYVGSVLLLNLVFSPLTGGSNFAVAVSTLTAAALFRPARRRIQDVVDRRFYRRRYDAARTLEHFTIRLRHEVNLTAVGRDLCTAAENTVQPTHVSLWIRP